MKKMNPELKAKWLENLRNGKYIQCQNTLRNDKGEYCCLGVLCVIKNDHLESIDNMTGSNEAVTHLVNMNDVQDKTFPEIADWIEENL